MREFCTYGSVRGALSNERPYRDRPAAGAMLTLLRLSRSPPAARANFLRPARDNRHCCGRAQDCRLYAVLA
jgi:hypothetical protein